MLAVLASTFFDSRINSLRDEWWTGNERREATCSAVRASLNREGHGHGGENSGGHDQKNQEEPSGGHSPVAAVAGPQGEWTVAAKTHSAHDRRRQKVPAWRRWCRGPWTLRSVASVRVVGEVMVSVRSAK